MHAWCKTGQILCKAANKDPAWNLFLHHPPPSSVIRGYQGHKQCRVDIHHQKWQFKNRSNLIHLLISYFPCRIAKFPMNLAKPIFAFIPYAVHNCLWAVCGVDCPPDSMFHAQTSSHPVNPTLGNVLLEPSRILTAGLPIRRRVCLHSVTSCGAGEPELPTWVCSDVRIRLLRLGLHSSSDLILLPFG